MKLESQEHANVSQLKERQKWEALAGNSETNNVNGETQNVNETIGAMRLQDPQETIQCNGENNSIYFQDSFPKIKGGNQH